MRVITFLLLTLVIVSMVGAVKAGAIVEDADYVKEIEVPGVPTELKSATVAPRTTVEYAQIILKTPLRIPNELLNRTSDTFPRTTVEYAQVILKNTLGISEELLNTTRSVAPRVIAEYSSKTAKMPLVFPKELLNDTTPPIITNVTIANITDNSATIKWDTCEMAGNLVKYGKVSGIYTQSKSNPLFVTNHTITLEGLSPGATYYFVVNSTDRSDNFVESSEHNFITTGMRNQPPIASFIHSPKNPIATQTIIFDASNSTDPDGTITNYEWDFGDAATGFGKVATHSYANNGTYNVTLTVTDNDDAADMRTKEITVGGAEDQSETPDQSSVRLYHSTIDDEIDIEIYGPLEPGLNTKVNYEVLITPTNQAGGPIHSGKVYFAYPDNNTNIYPVELWFKTCVDHNWYRIDMAEDFSRDEWINLGVDTLMSMGTGIPGLWGIAKMLLGPSYPTPPEGTAYFDDNAYDSIIIPYHPIGRKVPNSLLSIAPGEGVRVIIPIEFTQRRTTDLHFFINTQILSEPICHHTRDIVIYINAGR